MPYIDPLPYTLLSLPRYARIMGINPVHFAGGVGTSFFPASNCSDIYPRYSWQDADHVGHDDLAQLIAEAETDIARELGYWPAPMWIDNEVLPYPRYYRSGFYRTSMKGARGQGVSVDLEYGKFIQGGQRAVSLIGTATTAGLTLVFSDPDGDGYDELATITLPTTLSSSLQCHMKPYFAGEGGAQEWEIRPVKSVSVVAGSVIITLDAWLLLDPDLLGVYPTDDAWSPLNIETAGSYVASVDVYYEYNDFNASHGYMYWEAEPQTTILCTSCGGVGCQACALTTQSVCIHVRNTDTGAVVPVPASYDSDQDLWIQDAMSVKRDPDQVALNYYAGLQSNRYLRGLTCDPLDDHFARAIAYLATARLERGPCGCEQFVNLANELRRDMTVTSYEGGPSRFTPDSLLLNPFGAKVGEVKAYEMIRRYARTNLGVAI